ncbi:23S rRNA (adenine(2030)-N(6))-methyltransferase RlmJ [Methylocapsa palsarum]|uniref:Ribosomal RNA large subunit methyltransferase J n=1 Tax=Methylocapsa palsarum TaxID=1612308 RepID=A0A1I3Z5G7_9HYPH|nr:23S rRNA (adenine(2030)-N(6))-methyltransferase RlmJ [Methylocapsa palsarum]SFK38806.1 23S rRNA (adenine2030-N6)-methyltransferase [Methylocapsa palsarum]
MNYRHDFHAGNFADVFKHIFLTRILAHLAEKPGAFRVVETHAGGGVYDLSAPAAERTAEWRGGAGRLSRSTLASPALDLISPYLQILSPLLNADQPRYPGSPAIARALLRPHDRMVFCEFHPDASKALRRHMGADRRIKIIEIDGYVGLKAYLPPVERRGLVLIDPPFEDAGEFERLSGAVAAAWRKWATGIFVIWYPVKPDGGAALFARTLAKSGIRPILRLEFQISDPALRGPLTRCGLIIINPPYRLEAEAQLILPALVSLLGDGGGSHLAEWLAPEENQPRNFWDRT